MGSRNIDRMIPYDVRLDDVLRFGGHLLGFCADCGHYNVLPLRALLDRFGKEKLVGDIARQLVCKMCASRDVRIEAKFPAR